MRSGPTAGKTFLLDKVEISMGRDLSNDIVINDSEASRRHARIFLQGGNYIIEDLGSTNGTSVNGQRLMGPYVLRPGELIMLGESISLLFEMVQTDENATVVSPRKPAPEPVPQQYAPPPPAPRQQQPAYAGQMPAQPPAAQPAKPKKRSTLVIVLIVVLLLLLCVCIGALIWIDQANAWCSWFGWAFNMFSPGLCP
jgi:hypothetical protein